MAYTTDERIMFRACVSCHIASRHQMICPWCGEYKRKKVEVNHTKCSSCDGYWFSNNKCSSCGYTKSETDQEYTVILYGVTMTSTLHKLKQIAEKLGTKIGEDGIHYLSQKKGLIEIKKMDSHHLIAALAKRIRSIPTTSSTTNDYALNVAEYMRRDKTAFALLEELKKRS